MANKRHLFDLVTHLTCQINTPADLNRLVYRNDWAIKRFNPALNRLVYRNDWAIKRFNPASKEVNQNNGGVALWTNSKSRSPLAVKYQKKVSY
ncbi:MAG: hypothetical protein JRI56_11975 [Deltaproteobacteria bacterium]|nr:hypothetical protein [Deltaproteobacteria bacterium]